jgi:uncharacterized phage protein (TIGR01671 family)
MAKTKTKWGTDEPDVREKRPRVFRGWNKISKVMVDEVEIFVGKDTVNLNSIFTGESNAIMELTEWTGVIDNLERKVFEGDIVEWNYMFKGATSFRGEVVYVDHVQEGDLGKDNRFVGFMIRFADGGLADFPTVPITVVGDVYRTPNLLKL